MRLGLAVAALVPLVISGCAGEEAHDVPGAPPAGPPPLSFTAPGLEACVREALGRPEGTLSPGDVAGLVRLECQDRGITSLEGLESFQGLTTLSLWENRITDVTPLSGLTGLFELQLGNNEIADIVPLSGLTALERLGLELNRIAHLTSVTELRHLRYLNLDGNALTSLEPVSGLTDLVWLTADHNPLGESPVVAELRARGVVVSADFSEAKSVSAPKVPPAVLRPVLMGGRLHVEAAPDHRVTLSFSVGDRRHRVLPEFGDRLRARDGTIFLVGPTGDVAVGAGGELCAGPFAANCTVSVGVKASPSERDPRARDTAPVYTAALALKHRGRASGHGVHIEELVLASPNQLDAGSCLFMATTGAMELLLNQRVTPAARQYGGDTDLSERFLMNASEAVSSNTLRWFFTDALYTYNVFGGSLLDREYPFVAGCTTEDGTPLSCQDQGAKYISTQGNWTNELPSGWRHELHPTPPVERTIVFVDPTRDEHSQWRVAVADDDAVERIKYELRTKKAPVLIVYNHFLYWHADMIVGYDDSASLGGCAMVQESVDYFRQHDAAAYADKIEQRMAQDGGCWQSGVFYVRDSIYDGTPEEPMYTYGGEARHQEKYSARIVERDYNWVRYLANHAYGMHRGR